MKNVNPCDIKTISSNLKKRFCKDCNIPIAIYDEPYFFERLKLYHKYYGTLWKWGRFIVNLDKYECEQDYFEEYSRIKDAAISDIKNTKEYQLFNEMDMNQFKVENRGISSKDIFHPSNADKVFLSIDIKKANFSSLYHFNPKIFADCDTWEKFIERYTDNPHIIDSKYIRQVILGNCNPKRHITYEKYLMDKVLDEVLDYIPLEYAVFFSNDEIVFDVTSYDDNSRFDLILDLYEEKFEVPISIELFTLRKFNGIDGYYKEIKHDPGKKIEFKCINNFMLPFAIRKFNGEEVQESDKVFYHEKCLAKFIEIPEL